MREPPRTARAKQATEASATLGEIAAFLKTHRLLLALHFGGFFLMALQGYSLFAWGAEYLIRIHHMSRTEAGITFGAIAMVLGVAGSLAGGGLSTLLIARGYKDGPMRLAALKCVAVAPLGILFGIVDTPMAALATMAPLTFLMSLTPGLGAAIVQTIAPSEMRGQLAAVYLFFASFLAMLLAPLVVALLMGSFFGGELGLGTALSALAAIAYPLAAVLLFAALPRYRQALQTTAA